MPKPPPKDDSFDFGYACGYNEGVWDEHKRMLKAVIVLFVAFCISIGFGLYQTFFYTPDIEQHLILYTQSELKEVAGFNIGTSIRCINTGLDDNITATDVHESCHALINGADPEYNFSHWCGENN